MTTNTSFIIALVLTIAVPINVALFVRDRHNGRPGMWTAFISVFGLMVFFYDLASMVQGR